LVIQVGFKILYDQDHIPDAVFTGPASFPAGRAALRDSLKNINRNRNIILYCGCCKWKDCPNIRPAFKTVQELGFQNVKVLFLEDTFVKDWEQKGYPVTKWLS
jgi:thiosulfate/3-mercaptopyruvate sulfurtransferase